MDGLSVWNVHPKLIWRIWSLKFVEFGLKLKSAWDRGSRCHDSVAGSYGRPTIKCCQPIWCFVFLNRSWHFRIHWRERNLCVITLDDRKWVVQALSESKRTWTSPLTSNLLGRVIDTFITCLHFCWDKEYPYIVGELFPWFQPRTAAIARTRTRLSRIFTITSPTSSSTTRISTRSIRSTMTVSKTRNVRGQTDALP